MAATGSTPISLYYSATASNVPTAGNLVAGELAINTADGKLFYKDSSGVVQVIGTKGGVGSSTTTQVLYNSSGLVVGSANMVFDGSTLTTLNSAYTGTLTGGTGVVNLGSGQFYKASGGNVLIGSTTDNGFKFKVVGGNASNALIDNDGSRYTQLVLQRNSTGNTGGDLLIDGTNATMSMRMLAVGSMTFNTSSSAGDGVERMRIDSSGNVGIGTSSPASYGKFVVSGGVSAFANSNVDGALNSTVAFQTSTYNTQYQNIIQSSVSANYQSSIYAFRICSGSNTTAESMRIQGYKLILNGGSTSPDAGTGITFPATQTASSDANTLDDYEEGTWTPSLSTSISGTITTTDRSGTYTKVGNIVTVQGYFNVASVSSPTGDFRVGGLPFTANATYGSGAAAIQPYGFGTTQSVTAYYGIQSSNVTYFTIRGFLNGDQVVQIANNVKANTGMQFTVTYQVA